MYITSKAIYGPNRTSVWINMSENQTHLTTFGETSTYNFCKICPVLDTRYERKDLIFKNFQLPSIHRSQLTTQQIPFCLIILKIYIEKAYGAYNTMECENILHFEDSHLLGCQKLE
jgi:hypothetical protein